METFFLPNRKVVLDQSLRAKLIEQDTIFYIEKTVSLLQFADSLPQPLKAV